jgi:hypothetical protein
MIESVSSNASTLGGVATVPAQIVAQAEILIAPSSPQHSQSLHGRASGAAVMDDRGSKFCVSYKGKPMTSAKATDRTQKWQKQVRSMV